MAWTYANAVRKAALDGITALFTSGFAVLLSAADAELAKPVFNTTTAFAAASAADPSVAVAGAFTKDESITAGTIAKVKFQSSAPADLITGSVGTTSADFIVTDAVIPANAVSVNITGLTFSLTLS
jgi:hypothetical protein